MAFGKAPSTSRKSIEATLLLFEALCILLVKG